MLSDAGYRDAVRELSTRFGTLLVIDETHAICAGPGGYTAAHGLSPDLLAVGGIPCGTFGMPAEAVDRVETVVALQDIDVGGIGGTPAATRCR